MDCKNLQNVQLPESLREIGQMVFTGCASLKQLYVPAGVKQIGVWGSYGNFTIIGTKDSVAHSCAKKNQFTFIEGGPRDASSKDSAQHG